MIAPGLYGKRLFRGSVKLGKIREIYFAKFVSTPNMCLNYYYCYYYCYYYTVSQKSFTPNTFCREFHSE